MVERVRLRCVTITGSCLWQVLHYSGNLDIVVNVPMTEAFLDHVEWSGLEKYRGSQRQQWWVNGKLAGWFVTIGNFTRVRNKGCS